MTASTLLSRPDGFQDVFGSKRGVGLHTEEQRKEDRSSAFMHNDGDKAAAFLAELSLEISKGDIKRTVAMLNSHTGTLHWTADTVASTIFKTLIDYMVSKQDISLMLAFHKRATTAANISAPYSKGSRENLQYGLNTLWRMRAERAFSDKTCTDVAAFRALFPSCDKDGLLGESTLEEKEVVISQVSRTLANRATLVASYSGHPWIHRQPDENYTLWHARMTELWPTEIAELSQL